jgi:glycosyltransferase involved in cell wall biosynthesis
MKNKLKLIAIITHNRPQFLNMSLSSLYKQSVALPPILVVDNDTNKTALPIVRKWRKRLTIAYVQEPKRGAPAARNTALTHCKSGWLAFIDDDAIAEKDWIKYACLSLEKLPEDHTVGFIVGQSGLANPDSLAAQAQYILHQTWFKERIKGTLARPETLDTKNCLLNCTAIHHHKILFDEQFVTDGSSGLEDTDFGKLLFQKGYQGHYANQMKVDHFEKDIYSGLLKKAYLRGVLRFRYDRKWNLTDTWIDNAPNMRLYSLPVLRNIAAWIRYVRRLVRNFDTWRRKKLLRLTLTQELYLVFFNQGYLDERRKLNKT